MIIKCSACEAENPATRFTCIRCGFPLRSIENLQPGEILKERFVIEKFIGKGGMGVIYKAKDMKLQRHVAIKILPLELRADEVSRKRFLREAQAASMLEHPNICIIHEIYEGDDIDFIVMQYIEGEDLKKKIKREGPLPWKDVLHYSIQIARALALAHSKGIIHRDIKPSNIMITEQGDVKVLDFGLAKLSFSEESLTRSDMVVGTVAYMSPEQCRGEKLDPSTDIFSLGIVMYEMLTGTNPFRGSDSGSTLYNIVNLQPDPPSKTGADVPEAFEKIVLRCLEKDRNRRYRDASQLLQDLLQLQQSLGPAEETAVVPAAGRGKRILKAAAMLLLLAGLAGGLYMGWKSGLLSYTKVKEAFVVKNFFVERNLNSLVGEAASYLLRKKLMLLKDVEVLDEETFQDLRRRYKDEKTFFKKEKIEALIEGKVKKYGNMIILEATLSSDDEKPITTSGEGEASLLLYQVDSLAEKIAGYCGKQFTAQRSVADMTTSSFKALTYYIRASHEWEKLSISRAKVYVEKALKADPSFSLAHYLAAEIEMFLANTRQARKHVEEALKHKEKLLPTDRWTIEALKADLDMRFRDKIRYLKKVVEATPRSKEAYYNLAEAYFHRADPYKAIKYYEKSLEIKPNFPPSINHLGYCYLYVGRHNDGILKFELYKRITDEANAFDSLGDGYFYAGDYLQAITNKEAALARDPSLTWIYGSLADIYFIKGCIKKAFEFNRLYEKVTKGKNLARVFIQRAYFKNELGMEDAEKDIEKAKKIFDVEDIHNLIPELHWVAALIYLRKGDLEKVQQEIKWMEKVISKYRVSYVNYFPILKYYLHAKAEYYLKKGDVGRGLAFYSRLMEIKEKLGYWTTPFERAYFTARKALAELRTGRLKEAFRTIEDGLQYNPNHPQLLFARALYYKLTGEKEEFERRLAELEGFYKHFPPADPDFIEKVLKKLLNWKKAASQPVRP